MKELPFCKYTKTKINPAFFPCPSNFYCNECLWLKTKKKERKTLPPKEKKILARPLFESQEVTYSGPDKPIFEQDWQPLKRAIREYKLNVRNAETVGEEVFWKKIESLCNWEDGNWAYLAEEEKTLILEGRKGSIKAIQKLVMLNPEMVHLPFVADILERIIKSVKYGDGRKIRQGREQWKGFLPSRESHRNPVPKNILRHLLKATMDERSITKAKAIKHLLKAFPTITKRQWDGTRIQ